MMWHNLLDFFLLFSSCGVKSRKLEIRNKEKSNAEPMSSLINIFNDVNKVLCLRRLFTPLVGMVAISKYGSHCSSEVCKLVMFS